MKINRNWFFFFCLLCLGIIKHLSRVQNFLHDSQTCKLSQLHKSFPKSIVKSTYHHILLKLLIIRGKKKNNCVQFFFCFIFRQDGCWFLCSYSQYHFHYSINKVNSREYSMVAERDRMPRAIIANSTQLNKLSFIAAITGLSKYY